MTYFGFCWSMGDGVPPVKGLRVARSIFGPKTIIRAGQDLGDLFSDPDLSKADWTPHDKAYANCAEAGIHWYNNAVNLPAHVTGGVPAYQTQVAGGAAWWLHTQAKLSLETIRAVFARTAELERQGFTDAPERALPQIAGDGIFQGGGSHIYHYEKLYRDEQAHTWAYDAPLGDGSPNSPPPGGAWHVWGERGHEEADSFCAPRPWLLDWSKIPPTDYDKVMEMGREVGSHFRNARFHGYGNEFGGTGFNIDMRFDGVNAPDGPDTVKDHLAPLLNAYYQGLWEATDAVTAGFEHDGVGIMMRCHEKVLVEPTYTSYHPYPKNGKTSLEMCQTEWWPALDAIKAQEAPEEARGEGIGEIDGDSLELVQFARDVIRERQQTAFFIVLEIGKFVDGFLTDSPRETVAGLAMRELVMQQANSRRRAAGK